MDMSWYNILCHCARLWCLAYKYIKWSLCITLLLGCLLHHVMIDYDYMYHYVYDVIKSHVSIWLKILCYLHCVTLRLWCLCHVAPYITQSNIKFMIFVMPCHDVIMPCRMIMSCYDVMTLCEVFVVMPRHIMIRYVVTLDSFAFMIFAMPYQAL